jgi:hypothetical protein
MCNIAPAQGLRPGLLSDVPLGLKNSRPLGEPCPEPRRGVSSPGCEPSKFRETWPCLGGLFCRSPRARHNSLIQDQTASQQNSCRVRKPRRNCFQSQYLKVPRNFEPHGLGWMNRPFRPKTKTSHHYRGFVLEQVLSGAGKLLVSARAVAGRKCQPTSHSATDFTKR